MGTSGNYHHGTVLIDSDRENIIKFCQLEGMKLILEFQKAGNMTDIENMIIKSLASWNFIMKRLEPYQLKQKVDDDNFVEQNLKSLFEVLTTFCKKKVSIGELVKDLEIPTVEMTKTTELSTCDSSEIKQFFHECKLKKVNSDLLNIVTKAELENSKSDSNYDSLEADEKEEGDFFEAPEWLDEGDESTGLARLIKNEGLKFDNLRQIDTFVEGLPILSEEVLKKIKDLTFCFDSKDIEIPVKSRFECLPNLLYKELSHVHYVTLNLNYTKCDDHILEYLLTGLEQITEMRQLSIYLRDSQITDDIFIRLMRVISSFRHLQKLMFSLKNPNITLNGISKLATAIESMKDPSKFVLELFVDCAKIRGVDLRILFSQVPYLVRINNHRLQSSKTL